MKAAIVIASKAKQSRRRPGAPPLMDCFVAALLAMTVGASWAAPP